MNRPLHPALSSLLLVLAAGVTLAGGAVLALGIGAAQLQLSGEEVSRAALASWNQDHLLLGTTIGWAAMILVGILVGRRVGHLDRKQMGLTSRGGRRLLVLGTLTGLALLLVPALGGWLAGGLVPHPESSTATDSGASALAGIAFTLPALLLAAFGEELLMRGLLLRLWEARFGTRTALLVSSAFFVVAHAANPEASLMGAVGVLLAGLLLGIAFVATGSLWFVTGIHLGWNAATSLVLGLPVSGFSLPSLLRLETKDSELARQLLGGGFGPEEGLAFHAALTLGMLLIFRFTRPEFRPRGAPPVTASEGDSP